MVNERENTVAAYESSNIYLDERARNELAELIRQAHKLPLSRTAFGDALCLVLEDISGFESPDPDILNDLIGVVWEVYRSAMRASKVSASA